MLTLAELCLLWSLWKRNTRKMTSWESEQCLIGELGLRVVGLVHVPRDLGAGAHETHDDCAEGLVSQCVRNDVREADHKMGLRSQFGDFLC